MKLRSQDEYPHSALTGNIIHACLEVHSFLKAGFPESVYHQALVREFESMALRFASEPEISVRYKDGHRIGMFKPDFVVEGSVIVELKALSALTDDHAAQVLGYLKATNLKIGLLVNFGQAQLKVKRFINAHHDPSAPSNPGLSA